MNLKMELNTDAENVQSLNEFIKEESPSGVISKIKKAPAVEGAMGMDTYLPIIELVLSSTVVTAGVKGLFDVIKKWFEIKRKAIEANTELAKIESEEKKVTFTKTTQDNQTETITLSLFNEAEREKFLEYIKK